MSHMQTRLITEKHQENPQLLERRQTAANLCKITFKMSPTQR